MRIVSFKTSIQIKPLNETAFTSKWTKIYILSTLTEISEMESKSLILFTKTCKKVGWGH